MSTRHYELLLGVEDEIRSLYEEAEVVLVMRAHASPDVVLRARVVVDGLGWLLRQLRAIDEEAS
jgi:hypothetical protein